ncbi:hypothetical protein Slin15195_G001870 [Septoria linicola]|uniref:Rhodopsin domain-containing protein n=1 Tax=Septoria linicola TaxID=215465 RepID=A0A9Q9AHB0_9PEZI|nr:hypothetical protein Slin14017_G001900 [Septoria linicola]USW46868.1 hypothetical protein Slin15195_G001870 [Septoria linicola]
MLSRSRWLDGPGFWWDDWLVMGLWVLSIEMAVCLVYLRDSWAGRDAIGIVTPHDIEEMLMWVYISVPFYIIGTYGSKVVWVALYMRMWDFNTPFRKMCWATVFVLVAATIAFTVGAIVVYWPFHYYLDDSAIVRQFHIGINLLPVVYSVAAINITMDFWVLLLPVPKLMSLTGVTRQRKARICVVFLLGFVVTATSVVRLRYIVPLHNTTNVTWDFAHFGTWSEIEVHLSMISCNLPALAGLFNRLRTRRRAVRNVQESDSTGYSGSSNRTPPKTPKLNTWSEGSASTSEQRQSEEQYEQIIMRPAQARAPG